LKRVLLDEDLPHKLRPQLSEFDVWTVVGAGWAGVKNGMLLLLAEESFDVFVTGDQNIPHQQNLRRTTLGIVLLRTSGTRFKDIQPHIQEIRDAIGRVAPGELVYVPPEQ
jgi:hypothetical protein